MPMIIPPMPWYTPSHGGYFLSKSNLLRLSLEVPEPETKGPEIPKFDKYILFKNFL